MFQTASYVGMERSALHRKMKLLNIESTLKKNNKLIKEKLMKIIVCGAGQVGLQIAKHLSDERMDIVIDKSSDLIKKVVDELDVSAVCGYASIQTFWNAGAT